GRAAGEPDVALLHHQVTGPGEADLLEDGVVGAQPLLGDPAAEPVVPVPPAVAGRGDGLDHPVLGVPGEPPGAARVDPADQPALPVVVDRRVVRPDQHGAVELPAGVPGPGQVAGLVVVVPLAFHPAGDDGADPAGL